MEHTIIEILKIVLPATIVVVMAYLMLKGFLDNQQDYWASQERLKRLDVSLQAQNDTLAVRFQAYERLILLLERTNPFKMISQYASQDLTAPEYQFILVSAIRQELDYNLTQQLYISNEAWSVTRSTVEELISIINTLSKQLPTEATGRDLVNLLITYFKDNEVSVPNDRAIFFLKEEAKKFMG